MRFVLVERRVLAPHATMAGCCHEHHHDDADHVKPGEGQQDLLYLSVDCDRITALNEHEAGSAARVVKPYDARLDEAHVLESDVDDELLITVPFTGSVRVRALLLRTGPGGTTPRAVHLYKNAESLDFDDAANETPPPTQKLTSIPETSEVVEIPLLAARFPDVQTLTLYIPGSLGGTRTRLSFLGFRGESRIAQRSGPAQIVYEAAPRIADHPRARASDTREAPL